MLNKLLKYDLKWIYILYHSYNIFYIWKNNTNI